MTTEPVSPPTPSGTGAATVLLALSLFFTSSVAAAVSQPLELQEIMQELGKHARVCGPPFPNQNGEISVPGHRATCTRQHGPPRPIA